MGGFYKQAEHMVCIQFPTGHFKSIQFTPSKGDTVLYPPHGAEEGEVEEFRVASREWRKTSVGTWALYIILEKV